MRAVGTATQPDAPACTLLPVSTPEQAVAAAQRIAPRSTHTAQVIVPMLSVSSVTGAGLTALHALLGALQGSRGAPATLAEEDTLFYADREFLVEGVGRVMAGTVLAGGVSLGQQLALVGGGVVRVSSIHRSHVSVECVDCGCWRHVDLSLLLHDSMHHHRSVLGPDESATLAIASAPASQPLDAAPLHPPKAPAPLQPPTASQPEIDEDDPFAGLMMGGFDDDLGAEDDPSDLGADPLHTPTPNDLHSISDGASSSILGSSPEAGSDWGGAASAPTRARPRRCGQAPRSGRPPLRSRSETHAQRMRCADVFGVRPLERRGSNNGGHRGAVLLGLTRPTVLQWCLECLVVIWSGVWPPRGLISGCWPPHGMEMK